MKLFLDTANIDAIEYWKGFGLAQGVTTNPTLLSAEGGDPTAQLQQITAMIEGPVSAQVTHVEAEGMIRQGKKLAAIADNIIVKVPATIEGLKAAQALKAEDIRLNITLTFEPSQAIPFIALNVDFVSFILGRVEDFGLSSQGLASKLKQLCQEMESTTQMLVASIRNSHHLLDAVQNGADAITIPPKTWENIYANPLTASGLGDFMSAWEQLSPAMREKYPS
ncbi:transaldolase family protein [Marinobacteraceae bacterium S3BR75-40.1]